MLNITNTLFSYKCRIKRLGKGCIVTDHKYKKHTHSFGYLPIYKNFDKILTNLLPLFHKAPI